MARRTRSKAKESRGPGCAFLFGLPFLAAGLFLVGFAGKIVVDWMRANREFVETECVVIDGRVVESPGDDSTTYRPEITFEFRADNRDYRVSGYGLTKISSSAGGRRARRIVDSYEIGGEYPCWYDPGNPERAVLSREFRVSMFVFMLVLGLPFAAVGGGICIGALFGKERTSLRHGKSKFVTRVLPKIPDARPGSGGRVVLRPESSLALKGLGLLALALFWNGIVSVFVVICVNGWRSGERPWFLTLFMIPFVAVGIGLMVATIRQFLAARRYRGLLVEADRNKAHPGDRIEIRARLVGRVTLSTWRVELVCKEHVTYTRGTTTSTEEKAVLTEPLDEAAGVTISESRPFDRQFAATIPADAMHSLRLGHNRITWAIRVIGDAPGWVDLEEDYPIVILPAGVNDAV